MLADHGQTCEGVRGPQYTLVLETENVRLWWSEAEQAARVCVGASEGVYQAGFAHPLAGLGWIHIARDLYAERETLHSKEHIAVPAVTKTRETARAWAARQGIALPSEEEQQRAIDRETGVRTVTDAGRAAPDLRSLPIVEDALDMQRRAELAGSSPAAPPWHDLIGGLRYHAIARAVLKALRECGVAYDARVVEAVAIAIQGAVEGER